MQEHRPTYPHSRGSERAPDADPAALPPLPRPEKWDAKSPTDVYALVTDRITAALEAGTVPWQKPWAAAGGLPRNVASGRPYRGMNVLLLSLGQPYLSPWWLTFKQAQDLGGRVRKGEKASVVTFWKRADLKPVADGEERTNDARPERRAPILRYYHVFNVEQCDGVQAPPSPEFTPHEHQRLQSCEGIVTGMPRRPTIQRDPRQAYYAPALDFIAIPDLSQFDSSEHYYATLFHELVHSTGHASRLARSSLGTPAPFGTHDYSKEELVAEFGAAFLCAHTGIFPATVENQAAYIGGWLAVLRKDKKLLPIAAAQAQRAADFILGLRADTDQPDAPEPGAVATDAPGEPAETGRQRDIQRVAALIAAEPEFRSGADTFPRCRERNRREGWIYRFHPSRRDPNQVVESYIRLDAGALDRAYELARAFLRGEIHLSALA